MTESEKPTVAFILSLIGGVFILLAGGMMSMMASYGYGGMMNGYWGYGMMSGYRWGASPGFGVMGGFGLGALFGIASVIFGVLIIVGSLMLHNNPAQHSKWGIMILVFSLLSIFGTGMAGLGVGFVLSLIGGILALTWKPHTTDKA